MGCNTSQKSDGNNGREKFLVDPDSQVRIQSAFKDFHFTVLGFTDAEGTPVLCAIILVCKVLKYEYVMGMNPFAEFEDSLLSDKNCDEKDKWFPYGPACDVRGKKVPCFISHSEIGSITSELLVAMLKHMDDCQVFDRT